jgi:cobalt/nickel transport protein
VIAEINPDMQPWFEPIWSPPGGETESLLFSLQAALGAGIIGYFFGLKRGEQRAKPKA